MKPPTACHFFEVQSLVKQLIIEKVELIEAAKRGHRERALQYIEEGRGRTDHGQDSRVDGDV